MGSCGTFSVMVTQKDIVAAALPPVHNHWLPMSNLDLLVPPIDVGVFFCYKKSLGGDESVKLVKKSLAEALAAFYPFAGEVVENRDGEPELHCNNRGVDFIHACADVELKNIDLHHPDDSVQRKLIPIKKAGVFSAQVTEMKCGGLVIGCTFDHRVADAYSANLFLVAWAEVAQSKPISIVPCFRRSMLNPRRPQLSDTFYDTLFMPLSSLPPPTPCFSTNPLTSRIYYVKAKYIDQLQYTSTLNGNPKTSKFVSFVAFLWKLLADCEDGANSCRMGVVVDGRERLETVKYDKLSLTVSESSSMNSYFGNVLSMPYGQANSDELKQKPLSQVTTMVHNFISDAMTEEHFKGLIDWVEVHRPEPAIAKIVIKMEENDGEATVVSSGQRFQVESVDFGWGKPQFGSYYFPWRMQAGYIMPMPSVSGNGDWIVYMYLLQKHFDMIDSKGKEVFKPLTSTYLGF